MGCSKGKGAGIGGDETCLGGVRGATGDQLQVSVSELGSGTEGRGL